MTALVQVQREFISLEDPLVHHLDIISSRGESVPCHHSSTAVSSGGIVLLGQQGPQNNVQEWLCFFM